MIVLISIFAAISGSFMQYKMLNSNRLERLSSDGSILRRFLKNKISGFIIMGFIPGILVFSLYNQNPDNVGLALGQNKEYWYLYVTPAIIILINFFLAKNPDTFGRYPEMRFSGWNKSKLAVLVIGWMIYLLGYEFLFRGLLLFSVYHSYGLFVAFTVNIITYSLVHFHKGKDEMLGALPFGILLCSLAFLTGSIILPFLVHLSLALSTDFFTIHYNPDMKFVKS